MRIDEIIKICKENSKGYGEIDDEKSRDQILFGNTNKECTGIVSTIYASADVIAKAAEMNANLIIVHESLFWNHGDHTDWLENNRSFQMKKKLLEDNGITVWRNHDYIHSGIMIDGMWTDGIFGGLMKELNWKEYLVGNQSVPMDYKIPRCRAKKVSDYLKEKIGLSGIKCIGDTDGECERISFAHNHILGRAEKDNDYLTYVEENKVDTVIAMELCDFTLGIYVKDSAQMGINKRILATGHFNTEEPGMKYYAKYLKDLLPESIEISFIQAGDMYSYL